MTASKGYSTVPVVTVTVCTTSTAPSTMSASLSSNLGLDCIIVYNDVIPFATTDQVNLVSQAVADIAYFDTEFIFTTVFPYAPATGNLLIQISGTQGVVSSFGALKSMLFLRRSTIDSLCRFIC